MQDLPGRLQSPDAAERLEALQELIRQPRPELSEHLRPLLKDPEEPVYWAASVALAMSRDAESMQHALELWRRRGPYPGSQPYLEKYARYIAVLLVSLPRVGVPLEEVDYQLLERLGVTGIRVLLRAAEDPETQQEALRGLGLIGGSWAIKPLLGLLNHQEPQVRSGAAAALARVLSRLRGEGIAPNGESLSEVVAALTERIRSDPALEVKAGAAAALGATGDRAYYDQLVKGFQSAPESIRRGCALGLGYLGDSRALPVLSSGFLVPALREPCLEAVGNVPGPQATTLLLRTLDAALTRSMADLAERAAALLEARKPQLREQLPGLLEDPDPGVARAARRAAERWPDLLGA